MPPIKRISAKCSSLLSFAALLVALAGCSSMNEDPGSRTLGAVIDDQGIEATASSNIRKIDPTLDQANIIVTSYNGIVLLSGQAPSDDLRARAAQAAASVKNVRRVYNELSVGPNTEFSVRSADAFITTKVKSRMLAAKGIKDSRVKIVTENGTVYMMGLVTRAEGDIAAKVAQETSGVQKVVRMFEYVDG